MAIRRSKRDSNFTMISNVGLKDNRLSFKAKGLLSYMLSLPDDWVFYETEIVNHATDGKQSVRTGMKELEKFGYLVREQQRSSNGKFAKIDWVVSDEPINGDAAAFHPSTDFPAADNPSSAKRSSDNQTLLSTKELSTNKLNTNKGHSPAKAEQNIPYKEIIEYLNEKTDRDFKHTTKKTQSLIRARFNEGFALEDFEVAIDNKVKSWLNDKEYKKYLRPETLFGTKFESYLNEAPITSKKPKGHEKNYLSEIDQLMKGDC